MIFGAPDAAARASGHDFIRLREMSSRTLCKKRARRPEPRVGNGGLGNNCVDAGALQRFARDIEAPLWLHLHRYPVILFVI